MLPFFSNRFTLLLPQAGIWSGDLVLRDLQVRNDVSRKLHLPIVLKQGSVDFVRLEVGRRLGSFVPGCVRMLWSRDLTLMVL